MLVAREEECETVGEAQADIVGIGIIVGFVGQAIISLSLSCWVFFLSKHGRLDIHHHHHHHDPNQNQDHDQDQDQDRDQDNEGNKGGEHAIERKRLECVSDILMVGNDIQMLLGASLMITVFASAATNDLYHLHLVFDIVSFVGPSSAAALVCWTFCNTKLRPSPSSLEKRATTSRRSRILSWREKHWSPRHRAVYYFSAMYLALLILTTIRLHQWSPSHPLGRCYHAKLVTAPAALHPVVDIVYVVVTGAWNLGTMMAAALVGVRWRHSVILAAGAQFPVHLYMALALRAANQGFLEGEGEGGGEGRGHEGDENGWDFGQTTALVLLGMAGREVWNRGVEFWRFERDVKRRRLQTQRNRGKGAVREQQLEDAGAQAQAQAVMQQRRSEEADEVEEGASLVEPAHERRPESESESESESEETGQLEEGARFSQIDLVPADAR